MARNTISDVAVLADQAELIGEPFPAARAAGRELPGLVLDLEVSIVEREGTREADGQEDLRVALHSAGSSNRG